MVDDEELHLLARVARLAATPPVAAGAKPNAPSIVALAAGAFRTRPTRDATVPTGFDPLAAALFESIVEAAYLVANADGVFDATERRAFELVIQAACGAVVGADQVAALVSDLGDQLAEDGVDRRIEALAKAVTREEQAREILRIGALIATISDAASNAERAALGRIAAQCGLPTGSVDRALAEAERALARARACS
jgi:tellurite resistance protein